MSLAGRSPSVTRVLVTGGTGAVGVAVVNALAAAGHSLVVLSRTPRLWRSDTHVSCIQADLRDGTKSLAPVLETVSCVVHLAGLAHRPQPTRQDLFDYDRLNVAGTRDLITALPPGTRFVLASTIAVYGPTQPDALPDEHAPTRPQSPYAESKLQAESCVWRAADQGRIDGVILRLAAVYGRRVTGNYRALLEAIVANRFVPIGPGRNRRSLVHETDAAEAFRLAVTCPAAAGQTFNVTDGVPHEVREILAAMYEAAGRRPPRRAIPERVVRLVAHVHDSTIGRSRGVLLAPALNKYLEHSAVDGTKLQKELGFAPQVTLRSGWADAVAPLTRGARKGNEG